MSSDFNFTVTSWFLGNVRVKPYFNTQWGWGVTLSVPPPPLTYDVCVYQQPQKDETKDATSLKKCQHN